jgi:hypothetical protein
VLENLNVIQGFGIKLLDNGLEKWIRFNNNSAIDCDTDSTVCRVMKTRKCAASH